MRSLPYPGKSPTRLMSLVLVAFLLLPVAALRAAEAPPEVERLMLQQIDAVAANDHAAFIQNGNRAFRELMDAWSFDSIVMQRRARLAEGYRLEYLGMITRLGMSEYLWRVLPQEYSYHYLGHLSLADGKVVGFMLE